MVGDSWWHWAAGDPFWVRGVGRVEGDLAGLVDGAGGAEVDRSRGMPSDPGMAMNVVVLSEESFTEHSRVLDWDEGSGEVGSLEELSNVARRVPMTAPLVGIERPCERRNEMVFGMIRVSPGPSVMETVPVPEPTEAL